MSTQTSKREWAHLALNWNMITTFMCHGYRNQKTRNYTQEQRYHGLLLGAVKWLKESSNQSQMTSNREELERLPGKDRWFSSDLEKGIAQLDIAIQPMEASKAWIGSDAKERDFLETQATVIDDSTAAPPSTVNTTVTPTKHPTTTSGESATSVVLVHQPSIATPPKPASTVSDTHPTAPTDDDDDNDNEHV